MDCTTRHRSVRCEPQQAVRKLRRYMLGKYPAVALIDARKAARETFNSSRRARTQRASKSGGTCGDDTIALLELKGKDFPPTYEQDTATRFTPFGVQRRRSGEARRQPVASLGFSRGQAHWPRYSFARWVWMILWKPVAPLLRRRYRACASDLSLPRTIRLHFDGCESSDGMLSVKN